MKKLLRAPLKTIQSRSCTQPDITGPVFDNVTQKKTAADTIGIVCIMDVVGKFAGLRIQTIQTPCCSHKQLPITGNTNVKNIVAAQTLRIQGIMYKRRPFVCLPLEAV